MHNYHDAYDLLPVQRVNRNADSGFNQWIANYALLPFMEQQSLYSSISSYTTNIDPWQLDEANFGSTVAPIPAFMCPSDNVSILNLGNLNYVRQPGNIVMSLADGMNTLVNVQEGAPLAEATIELHPTTEMKYCPVMVTDENKAEMKTYGFPGIPAGVYKVVVIKEIKDNVVYRDNSSTGVKEMVSFQRYRAVKPEFSSAESSPHELEITGKEKTLEFYV